MRNIKLLIEYDGTNFFGWQIQPDLRTVQGEIESAFILLTGEKVRLTGSGRTDAGVHALGQVANVHINSQLPLESILNGLNHWLPEDVLIHKVEVVPNHFHARFDARQRGYRYQISKKRGVLDRNFSLYVNDSLNVKDLREATKYIIGRRSFTAFCKSDDNMSNFDCNVFSASWKNEANYLHFRIEANRFLRHMIRSIVGTLLDVGRGLLNFKEFKEILESENRSLAGKTAPARALFLEKVIY